MLWFKLSRAGLATRRKSKGPQIVPIRILLIRLMIYNLAKFGKLMLTFWFQLTELMGLHKSKLGDDDHWRAFSYSKCMNLKHFLSPCRAETSYSSNQSVEELSYSYQKLCRGPISQRCWGKDRSKGN